MGQEAGQPRELEIDKLRMYPAWRLEGPSAECVARATEELKKAGKPQEPLVVWRRWERRHKEPVLTHYLVTGRRYVYAAADMGMRELPVVLRQARSEKEVEREFLLDCLANDDMSPVGRGRAHDRLVELGMVPRQYAQPKAGTDPSMVTHLRRFVKLPQPVQWLIESDALGFKHGKALHPFEEWPKITVWLAVAALEGGWKAEKLAELMPATFGLVVGQREPAEWPEPGTPPFGAAWRTPKARTWFVGEITRRVEEGLFPQRAFKKIAGGMVAEVGTAAALEVIGWLAPELEEEALELDGQVLVVPNSSGDGRRDEAARRVVMAEVWGQWLLTIAKTDRALAWKIAAEAYLRWGGPESANSPHASYPTRPCRAGTPGEMSRGDPSGVWLPPRVT